MYKSGAQYRAIVDSIYARRKLNGDPDVIATDNTDTLIKIAEQGESIEDSLRIKGDRASLNLIDKAHREAI